MQTCLQCEYDSNPRFEAQEEQTNILPIQFASGSFGFDEDVMMTLPDAPETTNLPVEDLASRAYREIRQAIINLTFQPGQRLQETYLAEWLGTSRTPVREVLKRLRGEGLIANLSSGGAIVAQVSVDDVEDAYFVIEAMEGMASRLAAARMTAEQGLVLHLCLDRMKQTSGQGDMTSWTEADSQFHDAIRTIARSPKLEFVAHVVYPTIERVRSMYLLEGHEPDRLTIATEAHLALGDAIFAGNQDESETLARSLFAQARRDNIRLLRQWVSPLRRIF
jgi:DNA-binding GntR family transcriptional regulator